MRWNSVPEATKNIKTHLHVRTPIAQYCWDLHQCSDNKIKQRRFPTLHWHSFNAWGLKNAEDCMLLHIKSYGTVSLIRMAKRWKQASYVYRLFMKQKLTLQSLRHLAFCKFEPNWGDWGQLNPLNARYTTDASWHTFMILWVFIDLYCMNAWAPPVGARFTSLPSSKPQGWLLDPGADCIWQIMKVCSNLDVDVVISISICICIMYRIDNIW